MTNLSLTRVNQKLNQAAVLLKSAESNELNEVATNSIKEAVVFHLVCAYRHYLREIAETYSVKCADDCNSELVLASIFHTTNKYPAEIEELILLRKDDASWLAFMHKIGSKVI